MSQGFTKPGKHHAVETGEITQTFYQSPKRVHRHLGFGVIPDISDAGATVKVATRSWFDVELPCVREARVENQIAFPFIEPIFGVG